MENTLIIEERDIVQVVVLEGPQNYGNQAGAIDIDLLMEIKASINNLFYNFKLFFTSILIRY